MSFRVEAGRALDELVEPALLGSRTRRPPPRLAATAVVVAAIMLVPAFYLFVRAAQGGAGTLIETLWNQRTLTLIARTICLSAAVTAAALLIGVPLAWATSRTDLPARRIIAGLCTLPLVVPTYVGGYAFVATLGPKGIVQGWLRPLGVERLPEIYGFFGAWVVLTLFTYPYVLLTVRAAVRRLDPALEEASRSLGLGRRRTLRAVVLPQLRPAITASGLLVALYAIHDFGAVSLMRFDTLTRAIYTSYAGSFDRSRAATLSLSLIAIVAVVLWLEGRSRGRKVYYRAHAGAGRRSPAAPLGPWRWPSFAACLALIAAALGLPLVAIMYWLTHSVRAGGGIATTLASAVHSVEASLLAAILAVLFVWPVVVLGVRFPGRLAQATERATFVGYALPGIVVALSLVFFGIRVVPSLYQSLAMLVFAYVVLFLPQAGGALRASFLQMNPSMEEAARSLGAGPAARLRRVIVPAVRPGLVAGAALVFLTAMKELPATLLLAPTGFRTLATEVWSATNAAFFDRAALPALAIVLVAALPLAAILMREGEARSGRR